MPKKETAYSLDTKNKVVYVDFEKIPFELLQKFSLVYDVKDISEKPQDAEKAKEAKERATKDITKADIDKFFAVEANAEKYKEAKAQYDETRKGKGKGLGFFAAKASIKANAELYKAILKDAGKKEPTKK